ncbi:MAG TPA: alpha/beta hydrolase [Candidatus Saccharimonadales bacterium]|nr:alpha/beta hydrolase [Candidatus Saccharimonadales bacterium]
MKRAIIIHCWGGNPDYAWYPWVKKELEKKGYEVIVPSMPETDMPKAALWVPKLKEIIGTPDEDLVLIGHSIGCATIMRYLESVDDGQKVGKVIFVAGFTDNLGFGEIKNFFQYPINKKKIKKSVKRGIVAIQSDNDPYVPFSKFKDVLEADFDAKLVVKHGAGHMSGPVDDEESCLELPEVVAEVE